MYDRMLRVQHREQPPIDERPAALDLRRIAAFVAAAEELHFGRAAQRLFVSQPTLSQHVKTLENDWSVALFVRASRGVRMTEAGQRLLPAARRLLTSAHTFREQVSAVADGHGGTVTLGYVEEAFSTVMPALLGAVARMDAELRCPSRLLRNARHAARALREGLHDAVLTDPRHLPDTAERVLVARVPFVAAVPVRHPLAAPQHLELDALHAHPDLLASAASDGPVAAPGSTAPLGSTHEVILAVATGHGVAIVTDATRQAMPTDGVVYRELVGAPAMPIVLAWNAANENPALGVVTAAAPTPADVAVAA